MAKKKQDLIENSVPAENAHLQTAETVEDQTETVETPIVDNSASEQIEVHDSEARDSVAVESTQNKNNDAESLADRVRIVSPTKLVFKRFFRSRLSVIGLVIFLAVVVFSFLGPVFIGWGQSEVDRSLADRTEYQFAKYEEGSGDDKFTYYTYTVSRPEDFNQWARPFTYGINEDGKKALHVLGTDEEGQDIFVRLMYGGRLSLMLSFLVVIVYTLIGVILGGLAGYFGGWVDMLIMRLVDILNCLPSLPIMLIVGAFFDGSGLDPDLRIYFMMGVLTLMSWSGTARLVRGQILYLREQEYMIATDALGFSPVRKIFKHLVPNVMPQLIVSMTLGLGGTILTEASLSFLGLGAPKDTASLGQMVNSAKAPTVLANHVLDWLPAGFLIILAVVAFNFIGDGLRDALDPKMKR